MNQKFYAILNPNGTIKTIVDEFNINNYKKNIDINCVYQEIDLQELNVLTQEFEELYYLDDKWNKRPIKPNDCCDWSWEEYAWINNLRKAKETTSFNLSNALYLATTSASVVYNGIEYDATKDSLSAINSALLNVTGLETILWRDYDNTFQELTKTDLINLSKLIFDKQQELLAAFWIKKDEIALIEDFDNLLSYDTTL